MHKRFIAECFKDNDLIKDLFPLTASCIGYADTTNFFTEPCKECWWCIEKEWATADIFNYEPKVMLDNWVAFKERE